ncbi:MAG TPA: protein tyrosine phosphatase [Myxococcota bacterium]|nr:protein tyrosine phosphatase [Myxococcota bacterium]
MARICVCGLDDMPGVVEQVRPGRLISLLPAEFQPATPPRLPASDHLRVLIDDVTEPKEGFCTPAREHVEELLRFLRASPLDVSLVIHCHAGVSRSPAAALLALACDAPGREREAAELLREAAPFACPNRLLVELADSALGRGGALVAALDSIAEPQWTFEFRPFFLPRML